jgi:hypothetical protein
LEDNASVLEEGKETSEESKMMTTENDELAEKFGV